jgi:hypothetical protein
VPNVGSVGSARKSNSSMLVDRVTVGDPIGLATVGDGCSAHDVISTPATDSERKEASNLGEDISTPDD